MAGSAKFLKGQLLLDLAERRRTQGKTVEAFLLRRKGVRKRLVLGACQAAEDQLDAATRNARARLGPGKSERTWAEGLEMSTATALEYALGASTGLVDAGPLSRREREVVQMVAAGVFIDSHSWACSSQSWRTTFATGSRASSDRASSR